MSIFLLFELLVFIALKGVFLVLEYYKRHFPGLYCLKKKVEKMAIFGQKPWVNPFGKISIFRLFELLLFIAQKSVFLFQNIIKHIFQAYIALKKKLGKMAIFGPKPQVDPFGKVSIIRLFELLVFIAQESVFSFQNIIKDIFLAYIASKKKKLENGHFWTKTMGFFDFLNFLFLQPRRAFFRSRIS